MSKKQTPTPPGDMTIADIEKYLRETRHEILAAVQRLENATQLSVESIEIFSVDMAEIGAGARRVTTGVQITPKINFKP